MKKLLILGLVFGLVVGAAVSGCIENNDEPAELTAEERYEEFVEAAVDGDQETVEDVLHPGMMEDVDEEFISLWVSSFSAGYESVDTVEETELEDAIKEVEELEGDDLDNRVNYLEAELQNIVDEHGLDGYKIVIFSLTNVDGEKDQGFDAVFEDDGSWYVAV
ncbi:hypothetical protein [Methanonatronarchaeum sp. AMET6-2]|uniref:hypothetical protein n=1 Tax=Methanonatronarchaeum sp. AMET6-2 TaxID=2933293 RepID=UPI001FF4B38F|nr:hypothetical protein [Methanonatronarchaeum sp. AMET6-2]UOY09913.1 hypothetical protein MU439_06545 [Methanonatronarchaeum sp. AMET6-2]